MAALEQRIAEFIVETKAEDIPAASYAAAHQAVFDCVGCMLAGSVQPHGKMIVRFAEEEGRPGACTVVGAGMKTSPTEAALANGTLGHALDYDDGSGFSHASVNILPAALALGEIGNIAGRDLLAAYVIALEVGTHLQRGGHYVQGLRGFHMMTIFGTMAATAAAARIAGLTRAQTVMALGIAGSSSSGVVQNFGTYTKPLHAGMTSRSGVTAARLARAGWVAADNIIESKAGWASSFFGAGEYDPKAAAKGLGTEWTSASSLLLKRYPCCGSLHGPLDSLLSLMSEHHITEEDVREVEVADMPAHSHVLFYPQPANAYQGKFSMQYGIATALIDGRIDIDSFSDDKMARPQFARALGKVRIGVMSNWDAKQGARAGFPVTLRLNDGRELTRVTTHKTLYGSPGNPLTTKDLEDKFRSNARLALSEAQAEVALKQWAGLERRENIREALASVARSDRTTG
jgi:2-methylcitrate dehydratase PrpD